MNIEELSLATSLQLTTFLMPWLTILISIIMAMMIKDWATSLAKGIKFKFAAFRINSTPINTAIPLRLVITPKTPKENKIAAIKR